MVINANPVLMIDSDALHYDIITSANFLDKFGFLLDCKYN